MASTYHYGHLGPAASVAPIAAMTTMGKTHTLLTAAVLMLLP